MIGNFFIEINHCTRLDINSIPTGRDIMNHPCNAVSIGVFYRQDISPISTSNYSIRQHIGLTFQQVLQNLSDLVFIFLDAATDFSQFFTGKRLDKASFVDSL